VQEFKRCGAFWDLDSAWSRGVGGSLILVFVIIVFPISVSFAWSVPEIVGKHSKSVNDMCFPDVLACLVVHLFFNTVISFLSFGCPKHVWSLLSNMFGRVSMVLLFQSHLSFMFLVPSFSPPFQVSLSFNDTNYRTILN